MAKKVTDGSKVKIKYTATFDDGTVFDSSEQRGPLEFTVGQGQVIKGFERGVIGMEQGQKKKIKILPKDGYGDMDDRLLKTMPRDKFPPDLDLKKGSVLTFKDPEGKNYVVLVEEASKTEVTLNLNHPLAGKNLNFEIEVVSVE